MIKLLLFLLLCNFSLEDDTKCTKVSRSEEPLLVLSTLSGKLIAIDPITSETRWIQSDDETTNVRTNTQINDSSRIYLADPISGSLYKLQANSENRNQLTKLPYTIPELVQRSPCKSSDGILYSGKKKDSWIMIDPFTGKKEIVMGFDPPENHKPNENIGYATSRPVYLGRTQYTIQMFDSLSKNSNSKPWNVTFYGYNSHSMDEQLSKKYEFIHVTSSTTGKVVTINRKTGAFLWEKFDIDSPIISIFILSRDGFLSVPFTTVAEEVIDKVKEFSKNEDRSDVELIPTVFIGENKGKGDSFYAIPAYVDDNVPTIRSNIRRKNLLEGPISQNSDSKASSEKNGKLSKLDFIMLGYYENFETEKVSETINGRSTSGKELSILHEDHISFTKKNQFGEDNIIMPEDDEIGRKNVLVKNLSDITKDEIVPSKNLGMLKMSVSRFKNWFDNEDNKILKLMMIILIGMVITMGWYFHTTVRELRQQSQNGSNPIIRSSTDSNGSYGITDNGDESIEVGKITFDPKHILGRGCEGTFVFKGSFEKRDVAVKRLLPECFTLADREVTLLRESDTHENVVRYFCTESDRQFKYIAVELCVATLQDYVEGKTQLKLKEFIQPKEVLYQATRGLGHLHSLDIVHRDIKPQNVLISYPDSSNRVRALISDFGLCKKMTKGKASFSKRSGVVGSEGWMAPEMSKSSKKSNANMTKTIDIFSMGCVYYYVLSDGFHLFGDALKRQANILAYEYDMSKLVDSSLNKPHENILAIELINDMILKDPKKRPLSSAILKHPLFWREEKILSFLQDTSDRIEKLDIYTEPLRTLERNAKCIIREDWKLHLDEGLREDLRKHRDYLSMSVRDLLRALRNKKHHYHELTPNIRSTLGSVPVGFTQYWILRFPRLLSHSYHTMHACSNDPSFRRYYCPHTFTPPEYLNDESYDNHELKEIFDNLRQLYNKTPKKENRQMNGQQHKPEKSNKGSYNFVTSGVNSRNNFITREDMKPRDESKPVNRGKHKNSNQQNENTIIWTLPPKEDAKNQ